MVSCTIIYGVFRFRDIGRRDHKAASILWHNASTELQQQFRFWDSTGIWNDSWAVHDASAVRLSVRTSTCVGRNQLAMSAAFALSVCVNMWTSHWQLIRVRPSRYVTASCPMRRGGHRWIVQPLSAGILSDWIRSGNVWITMRMCIFGFEASATWNAGQLADCKLMHSTNAPSNWLGGVCSGLVLSIFSEHRWLVLVWSIGAAFYTHSWLGSQTKHRNSRPFTLLLYCHWRLRRLVQTCLRSDAFGNSDRFVYCESEKYKIMQLVARICGSDSAGPALRDPYFQILNLQ